MGDDFILPELGLRTKDVLAQAANICDKFQGYCKDKRANVAEGEQNNFINKLTEFDKQKNLFIEAAKQALIAGEDNKNLTKLQETYDAVKATKDSITELIPGYKDDVKAQVVGQPEKEPAVKVVDAPKASDPAPVKQGEVDVHGASASDGKEEKDGTLSTTADDDPEPKKPKPPPGKANVTSIHATFEAFFEFLMEVIAYRKELKEYKENHKSWEDRQKKKADDLDTKSSNDGFGISSDSSSPDLKVRAGTPDLEVRAGTPKLDLSQTTVTVSPVAHKVEEEAAKLKAQGDTWVEEGTSVGITTQHVLKAQEPLVVAPGPAQVVEGTPVVEGTTAVKKPKSPGPG